MSRIGGVQKVSGSRMFCDSRVQDYRAACFLGGGPIQAARDEIDF